MDDLRGSYMALELGPDRLALGIEDVTVIETTYLDLDGDGVPDAVHQTTVVRYHATGDGATDFVETVEQLATGIDVDGAPDHLELRDTVTVDFDHHGDPQMVHQRVIAA